MKLDKIEMIIIILILSLTIFICFGITTEANIKRQIIYEKSGRSVSAWTALNYPNEYFNDTTVRIENK